MHWEQWSVHHCPLEVTVTRKRVTPTQICTTGFQQSKFGISSPKLKKKLLEKNDSLRITLDFRMEPGKLPLLEGARNQPNFLICYCLKNRQDL